jgi:hypothetical protein
MREKESMGMVKMMEMEMPRREGDKKFNQLTKRSYYFWEEGGREGDETWSLK